MQAVARVNDIVHGFCDGPGHLPRRPFVGHFTTGSDIAMADGIPIVLVGGIGVTDCGHTFIAVTGSDVSGADDRRVHRVGDIVIVQEGGEGVTVTGSDILFSE